MAKKAQQSNIEQQLIDAVIDTYANPYAFVMLAFPWGKEGTELASFPDGPDKWHIELFLDLANHIIENIKREHAGKEKLSYKAAVKSGHGIGKSAMVSWLILWLMSTRMHCSGVVTANTATQLETKTWAELAKWKKMCITGHWFSMNTTSIYKTEHPETWRFDAAPWSVERTEAFAGLHNASSSAVMIFDEASAIHDLIWEVSEGSQTDGEPFWFAFGNPTKSSGRFFQCFNKFRERWKQITVDSREVRITNKTLIKEWAEDYGEDSDFFKVRVRGLFPSMGDTAFFNSDITEQAMRRELEDDVGSEVVMGIDPAGKGNNDTRITLREGRRIDPKMVWKLSGQDPMYVVGFISDLLSRLGHIDAIIIDEGGLGLGITARLQQLGYKVMGVNFGGSADDKKKYINKRHEMYGRFREALPVMDIPNNEDLRNEMLSMEIKDYDAYNRFQLQTKQEMRKEGKKSPDFLDSIVLTYAYKIIGRDAVNVRLKRNRGQRFAESEYDFFGEH